MRDGVIRITSYNVCYTKLLRIRPAFSATDLILRLIEHEVPDYGLVHLLDLPDEQLEVIEIIVCEGCRAAGLEVQQLELPEGSIVISVSYNFV